MPVPAIVALALHQRTAALDARELMLVRVDAWRDFDDRVVLSTCHRVEIYALVESLEPAAWLARELPGAGGLNLYSGVEAIRHLFEVASGLDSAVQGEPQIRGQVRALIDRPRPPHPLLRRLVDRALHVARAVRRADGLGRSRSVGSLAVDEVARLLDGSDPKRVLVIGAGEMGRLAVRALTRQVTHVVVANRDRARAEALARATGAEAVGLDDVPGALRDAEAVVSAADTRGHVLTASVLARRVAQRPLAVIDIAVPRSVDAEARSLRGLVYRSVDDLPGAQKLTSDQAAVLRARCAAEAVRFAGEIAERAASDAIRDVREHADKVRRREVQRAMRRLGHLSERDRRVVEALAARVVNSLLHAPTMALKEQPARGEHARALFGIGREPE